MLMAHITTMDYHEKINSAIITLESGQEEIVRGSDQHLDAIIKLSEILKVVGDAFKVLTDDIEENFNLFTEEQAREVISNIFPIFPVADKLLTTIAKTGLDADLPQLLADFRAEFSELREMVHDLSRFKANDTSEWDEIFKD